MERSAFLQHVENLQDEICQAIVNYCVANDLPVDWIDFLNATSQDLDTLTREILFYGIGVFPEVSMQRPANCA